MNTLREDFNLYDADKKIDLRKILRTREDGRSGDDPRVIAVTPAGPSFRQIRADEIQVDHTYQRPVSMAHVNRIVKKFDPALFGVVTVSERGDGSVFVLDGQHRVAAIIKMGRGHTRIPCEVLTGLTLQEESEVFHLRNSNKKTMTPQDKFRGALMSNDERAVAINRAVQACGFEINLDTSELNGGKIPAVAALDYVDRQFRDGHLEDTLTVIRHTWGAEVGPRGHLIIGMAYFLFLYRDQVNHKRIISQLSRYTLDQLYSEAKQYRQATGAEQQVSVAATILRHYNDRLREENKLPAIEVMRALNAMKEA